MVHAVLIIVWCFQMTVIVNERLWVKNTNSGIPLNLTSMVTTNSEMFILVPILEGNDHLWCPWDALFIFLCKKCLISSLMLHVSLMKATYLLMSQKNMQGFFGRQVLSIWVFFAKWSILPDSIALWMETNMPCDWF